MVKQLAEFVSPGHPDRLADAIADGIVKLAMSRDTDALVGVECAVHRDVVFIDGRIAAGHNKPAVCDDDITMVVRKAYARAGYGELWKPDPKNIKVLSNLVIEALEDDERGIRNISDDQNIVRGYAMNSPDTDFLPFAHFAVNTLGREMVSINKEFSSVLGPDFKLLACIVEDSRGSVRWDKLVFSCQHSADMDNFDVMRLLRGNVAKALTTCFKGNRTLFGLSEIENDRMIVNGAGDFLIGGPYGDNGLSGKKLAIDFYGTEIPIGAGAIYGKDYHKVDVAGAFKARQLALSLVKKHGYHSVDVRLAWASGDEVPCSIEAYCQDEFGFRTDIPSDELPPLDTFSIANAFHELTNCQSATGSMGGLSKIVF